MDMLCEYYATGGKSDAFQQHVERLKDYLWLAADGMKMQVRDAMHSRVIR